MGKLVRKEYAGPASLPRTKAGPVYPSRPCLRLSYRNVSNNQGDFPKARFLRNTRARSNLHMQHIQNGEPKICRNAQKLGPHLSHLKHVRIGTFPKHHFPQLRVKVGKVTNHQARAKSARRTPTARLANCNVPDMYKPLFSSPHLASGHFLTSFTSYKGKLGWDNSDTQTLANSAGER